MFRQPALPFFIGLPFMLLYSTYRLYVVYSTPLAISSVFHIDLNVKPKDYDQVKPAIENKTLGFQEIFTLTLSGRRDRIRGQSLAADATNLSIRVIDASRDDSIPRSRWPSEWKAEDHQPGELGCLVSHWDAWRRIINERITSALILESDADWDIRVHDIMAQLPRAVDALTDFYSWRSPLRRKFEPVSPQKPYGLNWDIIWLGHCGSSAYGKGRIYSWNDSTTPPKDQTWTFDKILEDDQYIRGTRALYQFTRTTCSTGYAISLDGAIKLNRTFHDAWQNIDMQLSSYCNDQTDLVCLSIWPQVFTAAQSHSNIEHTGKGDVADQKKPEKTKDGRPTGGPGLQFSAWRNADMLLRKMEKDKLVASWDTMWQPDEVNGKRKWVQYPLDRETALPNI